MEKFLCTLQSISMFKFIAVPTYKVELRAQNIANGEKLQGSGIYQSSYLLNQKGGKA